MKDQVDQIKMLLALMSDEDLKKLTTELHAEMGLRARAKIDRGDVEPLNDEEKKLASHSNIGAVKAYNDRTGQGILMSKLVVDRHLGR